MDEHLVLHIIAWFIFVTWQWYMGYGMKKDDREWYASYRRRIGMLAPPPWLFGVVWPILYLLITAAAVIYFYDKTMSSRISVFVLFVVNILLNKSWSVIFFLMRRLVLGAVVIGTMLATELAILILVGLDGEWLVFGLYVPYTLWTVFAFYLNVRFVMVRETKNERQRMNSERFPLTQDKIRF